MKLLFFFISVVFVPLISGKASDLEEKVWSELFLPANSFTLEVSKLTRVEEPKYEEIPGICLKFFPDKAQIRPFLKKEIQDRLTQDKEATLKQFPLNLSGEVKYTSQNFQSKDKTPIKINSKRINLIDMVFLVDLEKEGVFFRKNNNGTVVLKSSLPTSFFKKITLIRVDPNEPIWITCDLHFCSKEYFSKENPPFIKFWNAHVALKFYESKGCTLF